MNFFKKIKNLFSWNNMEDNTYIGGEEPVIMSNNEEGPVNWEDVFHDKVEPSIINLRKYYKEVDFVNNLINDLASKSISGWDIEADSEEIKQYLTEEFERLDLNSLMLSNVINNLVVGSAYYNVVIQDGKLSLRELAFDGEDYHIMEIKDPATGEVIGYKQVVRVNKNTNQGRDKKKFEELGGVEDLEKVEFNFLPDEVITTFFLTMHGEHEGILKTVLDDVYDYKSISRISRDNPLLNVSDYLKEYEKDFYRYFWSDSNSMWIQTVETDFVQKIIDKLLVLGNFKSGSAKIVFEKK